MAVLDLDLITTESAANFAAVNYLPTAEFAKLPEGATRSIKGKNYYLKDSRWHAADTGELLESRPEERERIMENATQKREGKEAKLLADQDKKDLIKDLNQRKPYTVIRSGDLIEIQKKPAMFDTGDFKFEISGSSIKIEGQKVTISESSVNFFGAAQNYLTPGQEYRLSPTASKLPENPNQYDIHQWLMDFDRGVLKKPDGKFAQFNKAMITIPAEKLSLILIYLNTPAADGQDPPYGDEMDEILAAKIDDKGDVIAIGRDGQKLLAIKIGNQETSIRLANYDELAKPESGAQFAQYPIGQEQIISSIKDVGDEAISTWLNQIKDMLLTADDLETAQEAIFELFPDLKSDDLADDVSNCLTLASLAGYFEAEFDYSQG